MSRVIIFILNFKDDENENIELAKNYLDEENLNKFTFSKRGFLSSKLEEQNEFQLVMESDKILIKGKLEIFNS